MRKVLSILWLLLLPMSILAQVKGKLVSGSDPEPIPYATISAYDETGKFVVGTRSDENGAFSLQANSPITKMTFQSIGFEKKDTLHVEGFHGDLGVIILESNTTHLQEVVATADMVRRNAGTETVFVTDSLRKGTVNAIQMLAKIPGVTTDWTTDEIKIGKDKDIPIIINGKEAKREYAVNLNPKRIKKVEILRYPAGKYSDYPVVLNFELADDYTGWDVNVYHSDMLGYVSKFNSELIGANFTYTLPKWSVYGDLKFKHKQECRASSYEYSNDENLVIKTDVSDYKHTNVKEQNNLGAFSLGIDYKMAPSQTLTLQGWLDVKGTRENELYYIWKNQNVENQKTMDDYDTKDYTIGLFYDGEFCDKLKIASEIVYNGYDISEDRKFAYDDDVTMNPYKGKKDYWRYYLMGRYPIGDKLSLTGDYTLIWKDYSNRNRETGDVIYRNHETRSKAMLSLHYQPLRNFSTMLGTHILTVKSEDRLNGKSETHTSWMPIFKGYWKPVKWMYFMVDYFCDVEYPNLDQLSTVQWQVNDVLWHKGNPYLNPRIMHYTQVAVNFDKIMRITYMFKQSKNEIIDYYQQDTGKTYQTLANCNFRHNYLGMDGEYELAKDLVLSLVLSYQWYHRYMDHDNKHFGRTWYWDSQLQWKVPGSKLGLQGGYFLRHDKFPLIQGVEYNEEESLSLGATYSLFKGKMPISLGITIPTELISKQTYTKINIPNFKYQLLGDDRIYSSRIMLSVKYNLGKGKTHKVTNDKNVDSEK